MNGKKRCINCFKEIDETIGGGEVCPACAFNNLTPELKGALKYETLLENRYCIGRVKCANSEGFTYAAFDTLEEHMVAVREFYPATLVYRDGERVCPAENCEDAYTSFFNEFLDMARGLIRMKSLAGVVPVLDMFWLNNTAYLVYEHYDTVSLKNYLEGHGGRLDWNGAKELFLPMMPTLSAMHTLGVRHLGISPETLRVCKDGKLRLSEFSIESVRRLGRGLEPDLIPGCPAYEQYTPNMQCEEITDVYSFSACVFYVITGKLPAGANRRVEDERLFVSRELMKTLPPHVVSALANGLQLRQEQRTGSFERLRAELVAAPQVESEVEETYAIKNLPKSHQRVPADHNVSPKVWLLVSFLVTVLIAAGGFYYLLNYTDFSFAKITASLEKKLETSASTVVDVPEMVGAQHMDWVDAMKDKTTYRFTLRVEAQEFSDTVPEGEIIRQSPEAGESVEQDGVVSIVVSRGKSFRALPRVNGEPFTKALALLQAEGFEVIKEEAYSDTIASGGVLWYSDDHNSGDELPYGSMVTVIVSIGKKKG